MKKAITLLLAFVLAFSLAACNSGEENEKTLAAPQNLSISSAGLITWSAVENATGYVVTVGDSESTVSETSYQVTSLDHDFTFSVYATAEGYTNSPAVSGSYTAPQVTVAIAGDSTVPAGRSIQLTATVTGSTDTSVTWSVTKGSEYASINADGLFTAEEVTGDHVVTVRATSKANISSYAEKSITVRAKTELTQAMLDVLAQQTTVEFTGYINVDIYTIGSRPQQVGSANLSVYTAMNGTYWYSDYEDSTGAHMELFYKNHEGIASEVSVSLMNDESFYPMTDSDGNEISWEASGLYNVFAGPESAPAALKVEDFSFNEQQFRWEYTGPDSTLATRMLASANPYEFVPTNLALVIEEGQILGITSDSAPDYQVMPGYESYMTLTAIVNYLEVEVPTIGKFERDERIHAPLEEAIENMQSLENYTMEFRHIQYSALTGTMLDLTGYKETITEDICLFEDFYWDYGASGNILYEYSGNIYGYKKLNENFYNTFYINREGGYDATRAYAADFQNAKPGFKFAAEIFNRYAEGGANDDYDWYYEVADGMGVVSTQFYFGVGNGEYPLYGLFAAIGWTGSSYVRPWVTVKDGYIVDAGFYYNMGYLSGIVELYYYDFNETVCEREVSFEARQIPSSWDEILFNEYADENVGQLFTEHVEEFFWEGVEIPFFGAALGDTYALAQEWIYTPMGQSPKAVISIYYDVPIDIDYTLETSLQAVCELLRAEGYTFDGQHELNSGYAYEFSNGELGIAVADVEGDLFIYVWAV